MKVLKSKTIQRIPKGTMLTQEQYLDFATEREMIKQDSMLLPYIQFEENVAYYEQRNVGYEKFDWQK